MDPLLEPPVCRLQSSASLGQTGSPFHPDRRTSLLVPLLGFGLGLGGRNLGRVSRSQLSLNSCPSVSASRVLGQQVCSAAPESSLALLCARMVPAISPQTLR